jgi:hypothetical protein
MDISADVIWGGGGVKYKKVEDNKCEMRKKKKGKYGGK